MRISSCSKRNYVSFRGYVSFLCVVLLLSVLGFSAQGRTLQWAGKNWLVKNGNALGPGPNDWSDSTNNVWVDTNNYLHLKITESGGSWYCAEIQSEQSFGYGEYRFLVGNRIDELDTNVVGGLFTYLDDDNEIDIEFVKAWTGTNNANFVKQPSRSSSQYKYYINLSGDFSTHRFLWETNSIFFQSYHSHGLPPPDPSFVIAEWTYASNDVPVAGEEKVCLNMWLFQGRTPTDTQHLEMILHDFIFVQSTNAPPPPTPLSGFYDNFNDQVLSNIWTYFNDSELTAETNGTLRVHPSSATDQAGVVTTNAITWDSSSGCVFRAQIDWIDVVQAGTSNDIDVKTLMAAVSEPTSPWFATNAAILLGAYSESNDTIGLSFRTKTHAASSMGIERFSGTISNASTYLGNGGLYLQFHLDSTLYKISAFDKDGLGVELNGSPTNHIGNHELGSTLTTTYWALGGQNWWDGSAYIYYDDTRIYFTESISTNAPPPPAVTNVITIGTDDYERRDPVNAYWEQNRLQTLYFADEINWTGDLQSIALNISEYPTYVLTNFTIRIQHTDMGVMTQGWISSGWTTVFQEDVTIPSNGWFTFVLTNTFAYNGTNNLVLDFSKNNDSWQNMGYCYWTKTGGYRSYYQYIDNSTDPLTWTGQQPLRYDSYPPRLSTRYPNVRLTFNEGGSEEDTDHDGMPDAWELSYFVDLTVASSNTDYDGDGFIDQYEYRAGTVPTNDSSLLKLLSPETGAASSIIIKWDSATGRTYLVQRCTNLMYEFVTLHSNVTATPMLNTYTDTTTTTEGPYFYRIELK